ncbi:MAG: hypothetical protein WCE44_16405 [Candidatus Velthaea sp.]|jgi:EamA domain-containing membrane protein RarD
MTAFLQAGYPYEIAGLAYYVLFLVMQRKANRERFSQRSRVFVLLAAIALVAMVPLHAAGNGAAIIAVGLIAVAALVSTFVDAR